MTFWLFSKIQLKAILETNAYLVMILPEMNVRIVVGVVVRGRRLQLLLHHSTLLIDQSIHRIAS